MRVLFASLLATTQCAEPLSEGWTNLGPCAEQEGCVRNGGASWLGTYWAVGEMATPNITADASSQDQLSVTIGPTGGHAFLVYRQQAPTPTSENSVLRVELVQMPNPATRAQFLFGMGDERERLLFEVSAGHIATRRDVGVDVDGEIKTDFLDFARHEETSGISTYDGQHAVRWLEIQEENGLVRFRIGDEEESLEHFDVRATPEGLEADTSGAAMLIGRWAPEDELVDPGQVRVRTFCHCPLPTP